MKKIVLLAFLLYSSFVGATQQIEEKLDLGGVRFDIDEFPLESHPSYEQIVKDIGSEMCSASWRGYQGIWSIAKDKLYLSHLIKNPCGDNSEYLDPTNLTGLKNTEGVASWYTGNITFRISRKSHLTKSVDGVSGEVYEAVVYEIRSGEVISRKIEKVQRIWQ